MKLNERLEAIRIASNLNQGEFAKKLNIEPGTYSGIKKNPPLELSKKIIFQLENELNVRKEWIENEEGDIFKTTDKNLNYTNPEPTKINSITTPIMTDQNILTEFFQALKRKDEQINRLIELQGRLFDKLDTSKEPGEV